MNLAGGSGQDDQRGPVSGHSRTLLRLSERSSIFANAGLVLILATGIWMAFAGPDWPRRGEWRDSATIYQNQVAATLAQSLGLDYGQQHPNAGRPIAQLLSR